MYAFIKAVLDSLLGWLVGEARNRGQATDAQENKELQQKIGRRIEEHLRERRATAAERFGGLHSHGACDGGCADQDRPRREG